MRRKASQALSAELPEALVFPRLEMLALLATLPGYTNACARLLRDGDAVRASPDNPHANPHVNNEHVL